MMGTSTLFSHVNLSRRLSQWTTVFLCTLFAILYGIWLQPHTVFIRNFCLLGGALISLPVIYARRKAFLSKNALPIGLMVLLLVWVTIHLFFIGVDFETQRMEYFKIWKKIAISMVFALGLGLSLSSSLSQGHQKLSVIGDDQKNSLRQSKQYWRIIFFGFCLPAIIFWIKLAITQLSIHWGWHPSPYLLQSEQIFTDPFAIHRSGYVFFTLPALAMALSRIALQVRQQQYSLKGCVVNGLVIAGTVAIYVIEADRLGLLFVVGLIGLTLLKNVKLRVLLGSPKQWAPLLLVAFVLLGFVGTRLKDNAQWKTFLSDAKMAVQVDHYENWKYTAEYLPINDKGVMVSGSNYQRIAWFIIGSRLAVSHPLGYGLMSQSFGRICKQIWPDSQTSWSHSAWLDFTLGYGWVGLGLFLFAAVLAYKQSALILPPFNSMGRDVLGVWIALFLVKEISAEAYVNAFIFVVVLVGALSLTQRERILKSQVDL
jgi:hypothetical protein